MHPEILLYTSPGCPDCAALKAWLERNGWHYTERDLSQPAIAAEAKARCGVRIAPVTVFGDRCFYGTFAEQVPGLRTALVQAESDRGRPSG